MCLGVCHLLIKKATQWLRILLLPLCCLEECDHSCGCFAAIKCGWCLVMLGWHVCVLLTVLRNIHKKSDCDQEWLWIPSSEHLINTERSTPETTGWDKQWETHHTYIIHQRRLVWTIQDMRCHFHTKSFKNLVSWSPMCQNIWLFLRFVIAITVENFRNPAKCFLVWFGPGLLAVVPFVSLLSPKSGKGHTDLEVFQRTWGLLCYSSLESPFHFLGLMCVS